MHAWYTPHLGRGIELIIAVPRELVVPKNDVEVAVHPRRRSTMATHHGGTCPAPTPASAARSCPPAPGPRNGRCRPRSPAWRSTNQGKMTEANASKSAKSAPKFAGSVKMALMGGKRCHPPPMKYACSANSKQHNRRRMRQTATYSASIRSAHADPAGTCTTSSSLCRRPGT